MRRPMLLLTKNSPCRKVWRLGVGSTLMACRGRLRRMAWCCSAYGYAREIEVNGAAWAVLIRWQPVIETERGTYLALFSLDTRSLQDSASTAL